jgi:hypothetical protein
MFLIFISAKISLKNPEQTGYSQSVLEATSDDVHKYIFWLFENKEQKVNKVE